jgi:hypothetical protein
VELQDGRAARRIGNESGRNADLVTEFRGFMIAAPPQTMSLFGGSITLISLVVPTASRNGSEKYRAPAAFTVQFFNTVMQM